MSPEMMEREKWPTDRKQKPIEKQYIYQLKPSRDFLKEVLDSDYIEYFPTGQEMGGVLLIFIGDWIDDVDFDQLKQEAAEAQDKNRWIVERRDNQ